MSLILVYKPDKVENMLVSFLKVRASFGFIYGYLIKKVIASTISFSYSQILIQLQNDIVDIFERWSVGSTFYIKWISIIFMVPQFKKTRKLIFSLFF